MPSLFPSRNRVVLCSRNFGCVRCNKIYKSFLVWGDKLSWSGYQKLSRDYKALRHRKALLFSSCAFQKKSCSWLILPLLVCLEWKVALSSVHTHGFRSRISSFDQHLDWEIKFIKRTPKCNTKKGCASLSEKTARIFLSSTTLLKENFLSSEFSKLCTI